MTGVPYHPGHVWRLLGDHGFSCQLPERRAIGRDEPNIRLWNRVEWPAIKKPATRAEPSSSSAEAVKGSQVIEFLRHLQRHVPGKLTVIWDGAPIHRSVMVQDYVASTGGRIVVERLPAYAAELKPVEYMWGNLKTHQIGNLIATQAWDLRMQATAALRRMHCRCHPRC